MNWTIPEREWPAAWRWMLAALVIVAHWLLFKFLAEAYITAFVRPRTVVYNADNFRGLELVGPVISIVMLLAMQLAYGIVSARVLLVIWVAIGIVVTALCAGYQIYSGLGFWPDVVCIVWLFAFHGMLPVAMTQQFGGRRPRS